MTETGAWPIDARVLDAARISRDARFDGRFFVAVVSTGIYCRPVCPAPSPKPVNVRYFPNAAAASEAGFRPCLRCRPEAAPGTPAWLGTTATVRRAMRLIDEGALDAGSIEDLAARVGVGPRHLHRLFLRHVGASPTAVALTRRLHFAKRLLDDTSLPVGEIALASGFGSVRRFNDAFIKTYGRTPSELRRGRREPVPEQGEIVLRLAYRPPYDWHALHAFLAARAVDGLESAEPGSYARTIAAGGREGTITVRPAAGQHALELAIRGAPPLALFAIAARVRQMFDLAADPALIARGLCSDPLIAPLVHAHPGMRVPGTWDPFELAVRAVLGQQISVPAARTLASRLVAQLGEPLAAPGPGLTHLFPTAERIAGADLSRVGLTGARAATLHGLARAVAAGELRFDAPPDAVQAALIALPGVGAWTAGYVALRALDDPDALPSGDLVLRRAAGDAAPLSAGALLRRAEAWRPWRSYAAFHLWRSAAAARGPRRAGRRVRAAHA